MKIKKIKKFIFGIFGKSKDAKIKRHYSFDDENHVHKLDDKNLYGATSVIKEVLPPPLAYYGSGMACKYLGWYDRKPRANYLPDEEGMPILEKRLAEIKAMNSSEFLNTLDEAYKAHSVYKEKRAEEGTDTHAKIEKIIKEAIRNNNGQLLDKYEDEEVEKFAVWGRGKKFLASEVHVWSEKIWVGGIIDLLYIDNGKVYLGDLKTSKGIYSSAFIQAGIYDYCQSENGFYSKKGKKLGKPVKIHGYTIVNLPPNKKLKVKTYYACEDMRKFAENLVELFKRKNKLEEYLND